jgi:hypothetical protein
MSPAPAFFVHPQPVTSVSATNVFSGEATAAAGWPRFIPPPPCGHRGGA